MPGEEPQRWRACVPLAGMLGCSTFCYLQGRAEAREEGDAGRVCLWCKKPHQGVEPACRFLLLSASGGSAFAAALAAPPGSVQCSAGPLRVLLRQMSLLG